MTTPDDPTDDEGADPTDLHVTRTARTRAATEVNRLGLQLTRLSSGDLDRLGLPERLRHEIAVSQGLKPRLRGRQNRLIGQLLRAEDHQAIRVRFDALKWGSGDGAQQQTRAERWLARLLKDGDSAVEALIEIHSGADRQRLRALTRTARQDPEAPKTKRARRELLRAVRKL
jgi:ribosome-associated protein